MRHYDDGRHSDLDGDPTPVTGGPKTPARLLRSIPEVGVPAAADELDKHVLRLIALHRQLATAFPGVDLSEMDSAAKWALLAEMQRSLGIKPVDFP